MNDESNSSGLELVVSFLFVFLLSDTTDAHIGRGVMSRYGCVNCNCIMKQMTVMKRSDYFVTTMLRIHRPAEQTQQ
jgi:hypothetical protein